ncbi:hypothetical protein K440DRAFT_128637 [Wilcoxina mikolae CBS 423.85]|nr:hypothetical protein K440DRAFT_128637 [Wilcoxina mikolae CBS 423.85]
MWSIKGCFMCMYVDIRRAGHLPNLLRMVMTATSVVLVVSFFLCMGINMFWCMPWERNWKLALDKCTAQTDPFAVSWASLWHVVSDMMGWWCPSIHLYPPLTCYRSSSRPNPHLPPRPAPSQGPFSFCLYTGPRPAHCAIRMISVFGSGSRIDKSKAEQETFLFIEQERERILEIRLMSISEATCGLFMLCLLTMRVFFRRRKPLVKWTPPPPPMNDDFELVNSVVSCISLDTR